MRMTAKRRQALEAIDRLDEASQSWGWQQDHGYGREAEASETKHKAAKAALLALVTTRRDDTAKVVDAFDDAAQRWGWQRDLGVGDAVPAAETAWKDAKAALVQVMIGGAAPPPTEKTIRLDDGRVLPLASEDVADRLEIRAAIRRRITTRRSVAEDRADRLADLLDEAAAEIRRLRAA